MMLSDTIKDSHDYNKFTYSVFKYKGEWAYCSDFGGSYMALRNLHTGKEEIIYHNKTPASDFSFMDHRVGYCNFKSGAVHLSLRTTGGGTRGISYVNVGIPDAIPHSTWNTMVFSPEFLMMLMGLYPSKEEAWAQVASPSPLNTRVSFHKDLMFVRNGLSIVTLFYKSKPVGELSRTNGCESLELYPAYHHLDRFMSQEGKFQHVLQTASQG